MEGGGKQESGNGPEAATTWWPNPQMHCLTLKKLMHIFSYDTNTIQLQITLLLSHEKGDMGRRPEFNCWEY